MAGREFDLFLSVNIVLSSVYLAINLTSLYSDHFRHIKPGEEYSMDLNVYLLDEFTLGEGQEGRLLVITLY
jgi:hypothetical protein